MVDEMVPMKYIADSFNLEPKAPKVKMYMYVLATTFYQYNIVTDQEEPGFHADWRVAMNETEARYTHLQLLYQLYPGCRIWATDTGMVDFDDVKEVYISHQ